jgi:ubiquinone/menaquinone biosynthesis C-methylase UbiE
MTISQRLSPRIIVSEKTRIIRTAFTSTLSLPSQAKVLDLACGDGFDANQYQKADLDVVGVDASKELIRIAKEKYPSVEFRVGLAESLPYQNECFDAVFSKYAIMTSPDIQPIINEAHRVLKAGGYFVYLVTHPFRQYFEKKNHDADYFQQEVVTAHILNGSVSVREPSHTFNEYFSKNFLEKFDLVAYVEAFDPAAERVDGRTYPGYFIVVAKKHV